MGRPIRMISDRPILHDGLTATSSGLTKRASRSPLQGVSKPKLRPVGSLTEEHTKERRKSP